MAIQSLKPHVGLPPIWDNNPMNIPAPVGAWVLNEGTGDDVLDGSGNDKNLSLATTTTWEAGGIRFNGVGESIVSDYPASEVWNTEIGTIVLGYTLLGTFTAVGAIYNIDNATNDVDDETSITELGDGNLYFHPNGDEVADRWEFGTITDSFPVGTEKQIAVTWDRVGGIISGRIDGVTVGSRAGAGSWGAANWDGSERISIGGRGISHPGTDYSCNGIISYFYVYDVVLTPAQIHLVRTNPYYAWDYLDDTLIAILAAQVAAGGLSIPRPLSRPFSGPLGGI